MSIMLANKIFRGLPKNQLEVEEIIEAIEFHYQEFYFESFCEEIAEQYPNTANSSHEDFYTAVICDPTIQKSIVTTYNCFVRYEILLDENGNVLGQSSGLPLFLGNLEVCIKETARMFGWDIFKEGDKNSENIIGVILCIKFPIVIF